MYSEELKIRAVHLVARGNLTRDEIAVLLGVSLRTLDYWLAGPKFQAQVAEAKRRLAKDNLQGGKRRPRKSDAEVVSLLEKRRLRRDQSRHRFYRFIQQIWPVAEARWNFVRDLQIETVANHLEAVAEGKIRRLLITMPPETGKTLLGSVLWPAWIWLRRPQWRGLFISATTEQVMRASLRFRAVVTSEQYRTRHHPYWQLERRETMPGDIENDQAGQRLVLAPRDWRECPKVDSLILDDPLDMQRTYGEPELRGFLEWFRRERSKMLKPDGSIVVMMHRRAENDLAGCLLTQEQFEHLNLPAEYVPAARSVTSIGGDMRKKDGEILMPGVLTAGVLAAAKERLGPEEYGTRYQQQPPVKKGSYFAPHLWQFWVPTQWAEAIWLRDPDGTLRRARLRPLPEAEEYLMGWYCGIKDFETVGVGVGQVWQSHRGRYYLLEHVSGRMDAQELAAAIWKMREKWPEARIGAIDIKCNGAKAFRRFAEALPQMRINADPPTRNLNRASRLTTLQKEGFLFLPHTEAHPWVNEMLDQCTEYPYGTRYEYVEAMSAALAG